MPKLPSKDTLSPSETKVGHSFEVRAKENKIFAGIHVGSTKYAHKMIDLGYNFVSILSDGRIMTQAIENILKEMKEDDIEKKSSIY